MFHARRPRGSRRLPFGIFAKLPNDRLIGHRSLVPRAARKGYLPAPKPCLIADWRALRFMSLIVLNLIQ